MSRIPAKPPLHPTVLGESSASYGSIHGLAFLVDTSFDENDANADLNSSTLSMYSADLEEGLDDLAPFWRRGIRTKSATSEAFERALRGGAAEGCWRMPRCCMKRDDFYYSESYHSRGGFVNCVKDYGSRNDRAISLACIVILGMSNVVPW